MIRSAGALREAPAEGRRGPRSGDAEPWAASGRRRGAPGGLRPGPRDAGLRAAFGRGPGTRGSGLPLAGAPGTRGCGRPSAVEVEPRAASGRSPVTGAMVTGIDRREGGGDVRQMPHTLHLGNSCGKT